ncbi:DUF819 domain-containing protein [Cinnamomum micranthum f. kanehirae]|uniref:DUF819 domain-containing protein n=1 Tax=Cinnamomum micranthum f. kanehirae TaxID=337451 RepID=A0A3S4PAM1_9MAGN|nr:DUF819 domain-containing protein [Cinnamomum micranthum f. kanehirae]
MASSLYSTTRSRSLPSQFQNPSFSFSRHLSTVSQLPFPNRTPFSSLSYSPKSTTITARFNISLSSPSLPLISPHDQWGTWTSLFSIAAFGLWSEKTKVGSALSGALVSTLVGLAASNLGIIACDAPAYSIVMEYLLPIAVPLLLFRADLRRVVRSTGMLLLAFLLGSVATTIGTVVAYLLVPMRSLGQDSWKIAAALMSRHIGGAVNYVAVSEALGVSSSVLAAGLAADNVICAMYFTSLFALASRIPAEASTSTNDSPVDTETQSSNKLPVLQTATALATAFAICKIASYLTKLGLKGGILPAVTAIVVVLATIFPAQFGYLAPTGEAIALILMQVAVHLSFILGVGKLLRFDQKLLLVASNANVGGPTTACGMATAKGWSSLIVPGILAGIFGIAIATFIGIAFGLSRFHSCIHLDSKISIQTLSHSLSTHGVFVIFLFLSSLLAIPIPNLQKIKSFLAPSANSLTSTKPYNPCFHFSTPQQIQSQCKDESTFQYILSIVISSSHLSAGPLGNVGLSLLHCRFRNLRTAIGSMLSAAIVSILVGLVASNLGILPFEAPAYSVVMDFLLPVAVPLLLFKADLRRIFRSTGTLLVVFLLGSVATTIGTAVAYLLVPMRSLGQDSWKIAAALMSSYIGGAVNYVAVSEALGVSPSVMAAGIAVDNVICAIYFTTLFALASKIPPEASLSSTDATDMEPEARTKLPVSQTTIALAVSLAICKFSTYLTKLLGFNGGSLQCITAMVVILATIFPSQFGFLAPAGEAIALILMQVFFAVVGASGSIWSVINTAPSIFAFACIQLPPLTGDLSDIWQELLQIPISVAGICIEVVWSNYNRIAGCSERKIRQRRQKLCHILNSESARTLFSYFSNLLVNGKALLTWNMPTVNVTKMVAQRRISGNQVTVGIFYLAFCSHYYCCLHLALTQIEFFFG